MATTTRKPTKAERRAHDVRTAELFPDTAGRRADLRPCACCGSRDHGGELGLGSDGATGWCTPCANRAWDRAAHRAAFWDVETHSDVRSDAAW